MRDVCARYPIDGLHLDYIRYNHMLYGWGDEDLVRYERAGADCARLKKLMDEAYLGDGRREDMLIDAARSGDQDLCAFAAVRRSDVWHFAKTLCDTAREARMDIALSTALMPEGAYPDHTFADLHYGQSYEDAAKLYHHVLPMAYSKAYENKDGAWVRDVARWTLAYGMKAVMGLHAYEDGTGQTLYEDIGALADLPVEGICLFREGACAWAFARDGQVQVYNNLDEPIERIISVGGTETAVDCLIAPDEEKSFPCAGDIRFLRAFTEKGECSVHLTRE